MTLAPANDPHAISSPPGSPSTPRPQNSAGISEHQDKTEMELELSGGLLKQYTPSGGSHPLVESIHDRQVDVDPSRSPGTPSASGDHPESNQTSTKTGDVTMSGLDNTGAELGPVSPPLTEHPEASHPSQEKPQQFGDTPPCGTCQNEVVDSTASRPRSPSPQHLYSLPRENGTQLQADTSRVEDIVMVAHDQDTGSDGSAPDTHKRTIKSSQSKQKRPPDVISQGPAKRARTSPVTCVNPVVSPVSDNLFSHTTDRGHVPENLNYDSPSLPMPTVIADTEAGQQRDVVDVVPVCDSSTTNPQTTSESNSSSDSDPIPSPDSPSKIAHSSETSSQPLSLGPSQASAQDKSPQTKPTAANTSSLANNPYLALSTAFLKGSTNSATTGYNPYSLYYGPGTPITPHTPTYPYPYLYQIPSPASAAMYPTSPTYVTSPTQKSPSPLTHPGAEPPRQRPKRLKAHTVTSGNHNIPIVPRDKKGKPMLPLNVGIMTVISLGEVCMREHFHTERYIFPVGYEVTRRYLSTVDSNAEVVYHCTILDGGDGPKFQIVPSDAPGREVIAGTATGAWSSIVKQANAIRSRQHSNSVSGPDFFGLGQNTIKHLIQELPNADRLKDYVWQNFIEGGPLGGRHAAVTPALPEDYDSTLPIGALYPVERDRLKREIATSPRGLNHYPQHIIAQAESQSQRKEQIDSQPSGQQTNLNHQLLPTGMALPAPNGHASVASGSPSQLLGPGAVISSQSHVLTPPIPQGPSSVPTTIASIMSAYPAPVATPPAAASPSTPPSSSTSSLPS